MSRRAAPLLAGLMLVAAVAVPLVAIAPPAEAACQPVLKSLTLAKATVTGGSSTTGAVKLSCRAPRKQKVRLRAPAGITTPEFVWVARGTKSSAFTVMTSPTSSRAAGKLTATYQRKSVRRTLTRQVTPCYPGPVPQSVTLPPTLYAGGTGNGSITLSCAARTTVLVNVSSSTSRVIVPATVTIAAGSRTATFVVATKVPASSEGAFSATIRASAAGRSAQQTVQVNPGLRDLQILQTPGAGTARITVTLTGPTVRATEVKVSQDQGALNLPGHVIVAKGATSASVLVPLYRHDWDQPVVLTAAFGGRQVTASTTVGRYFRQGDTYVVDEPTMTLTGEGLTARGILHLTLDHPVGPDGLGVEYSDSDGHGYGRVSIPQGGLTADLPFYVNWFGSGQATLAITLETERSAVIDYGREVSFTMHPAIAAVDTPAPIIVGRASTGTVTLIAAAAQDETVLLAGNGVAVPTSVTVPAGATSATFPVAATAAGSGTISASLRGSTKTSAEVAIGAAIPDACRPTGISVPADVYSAPEDGDTLPYHATLTLGCTTSTELLVPLRIEDEDDRYELQVPDFVRVPPGASTGTFTFTTSGGGGCYFQSCVTTQDVDITAGPTDLSTTKTVTIKPGLFSIGKQKDPETGRYDLVVYLTGDAEPGTVATITTSDPDVLAYPSSVELPEGGWAFVVPAAVSVKQPAGTTVRVTVSVGPAVVSVDFGVFA
jgi:hypothetical protein